MTYGTLISTQTVGAGGATSFTFSSIPQTYTDLLMVWSARDNNAAIYHDLVATFNSSTTTYTERMLYTVVSSSPQSYSTSNPGVGWTTAAGANATANTFNNGQLYIPNYAGSTNKAFAIDNVSENNATAAWLALNAGVWATTSAITSITVSSQGGATIQQYSTFSLYGIK